MKMVRYGIAFFLLLGMTPTGYSEPTAAENPDAFLARERFQNLRDPFWPVGFEPVSEAELIEKTHISNLQSRIRWPSLALQGITHSGGENFIAFLKGIGMVETGEIISMKKDGIIYRWQVDRVTANGISTSRLHVEEVTGDQPENAD